MAFVEMPLVPARVGPVIFRLRTSNGHPISTSIAHQIYLKHSGMKRDDIRLGSIANAVFAQSAENVPLVYSPEKYVSSL